MPGSGRYPEEGKSNPLQDYCLKNMDRGAWQVTVHRVTESQTPLSDSAELDCHFSCV